MRQSYPKAKPGAEQHPGLTGRVKWAVDTSTATSGEKVRSRTGALVVLKWGGCQRTVRAEAPSAPCN